MTYANGSVYRGDWKGNLRHGEGSFVGGDESEYHGDWKMGKKDGRGVYVSPFKGEAYEGEWKEGAKHGTGRLIQSSGCYDGSFSCGKFDGRGTLLFSNGGKYVGSFCEGKMCGVGIMHYPDGVVYKGEWADMMRHGRGVCSYPEGHVYTGKFFNGRFHANRARMENKTTGELYDGAFVHGSMEGRARYFLQTATSLPAHSSVALLQAKAHTSGVTQARCTRDSSTET